MADEEKTPEADQPPQGSGEATGGTDSPREKKARSDATQSPRKAPPSPRHLLVAASPPKYVSFDDIMKAANGVTNMALAHEIAVDNDFRFNKYQPQPGSLESQVRAVAERAFWDIMEEKINCETPCVEQVVVLIKDLKEKVEALLVPGARSLQAQVDQVLDVNLIEQQVEHGVIDVRRYGEFVISLLEKLCAPARDEEVAKLRQVQDTVQLFKEIFRVIDLLQMDMANFTIDQMRPYIQQHSVEFERKKFSEFMAAQQELGVDGLECTKSWLKRNLQLLEDQNNSPSETKQTTSAESGPAASATSQTGAASAGVTPSQLINQSFIELLDWPDNLIFPETVVMDEGRFNDLEVKVNWLSLVSSVLLVTYNTVGGAISGIAGLKETLKDHMASILAGVKRKDVPTSMSSVAAQVLKDVNECLTKHGFPALDAARQEMLEGQVQAVGEADHPLRKLTHGRLMSFFVSLISARQSPSMQVPAGLSAVSTELSHVSGQFLRLVSHNKAVFGPTYVQLIGSLLQETQ